MSAKKKKPSTYRVFVYGTLRAGMHNHHWLKGSRLVAETETEHAAYTMLDISGFFPGVIRGGNATIIGEVYAVDAVTLAELDRHEGCPNHYKREIVKTKDCGECFTYIYQMPSRARAFPNAIVRHGDWCRHAGLTGKQELACVRQPGTLFQKA